MKKLLSALLAAILTVPAVSAAEADGGGLISGWKFAPLQIGLGIDGWRNLVDDRTDTLFSFIFLSMNQESAVFSLATIGGVRNNYGISIAAVNCSTENYGIKIGLVNFRKFFESTQILGINIADAVQIGVLNDQAPVQIGLLNGRGRFQIGVWNYCPRSRVPYFPLINFDMGK